MSKTQSRNRGLVRAGFYQPREIEIILRDHKFTQIHSGILDKKGSKVIFGRKQWVSKCKTSKN